MKEKESLKDSPKFEFASVSEDQRRAIRAIESAESEFIYKLYNHAPSSPHIVVAIKALRHAAKQAYASILFYWKNNA